MMSFLMMIFLFNGEKNGRKQMDVRKSESGKKDKK